MEHLAQTLIAVGGAFAVCGVLARLGVPIGLPTIPLFMLAGVVFGPHTPGVVLIGDPSELALLAKLGLIFLLLYLGLEFSVDQLTSGGLRLAAAAGCYLALNIGFGIVFGLALGWGSAEALVIAGIVGISSSAIVTKLLVENRRLANPETRLILGIVVIEDVFLALYLAALQPVLGGADSAAEAAQGMGTAFAFLIGLSLLARYGSRLMSKLVRGDDEILVVIAAGLAISTAGLAELLGVSDAIGAFMIGLILAATTVGPRLRKLVHPLRDAFGAVFFFHFGLTIDPGAVLGVVPQILVAAAMTIVLALVSGVLVARMHRFGRVEAFNVGVTVLARGEFSLVLAAMALAAGMDSRIGPFTAGYILLLAVASPLLAPHSGRLAVIVPRRLLDRAGPVAELPEEDGVDAVRSPAAVG